MKFYKVRMIRAKINTSEPPGYCCAVAGKSDGLFYVRKHVFDLLKSKIEAYVFEVDGVQPYPFIDIVGFPWEDHMEPRTTEEVLEWMNLHGYRIGDTNIEDYMPTELMRSFRPGWYTDGGLKGAGVEGESIINIPVGMRQLTIREIVDLLKDTPSPNSFHVTTDMLGQLLKKGEI